MTFLQEYYFDNTAFTFSKKGNPLSTDPNAFKLLTTKSNCFE